MSPLERDLGEVAAGEAVPAAFTLRNSGGAELRLRTVTGDCGCISARHPQVLGPGQEAELAVRFEPPPLWNGPVERRIRVELGGGAPPVEVKLRATIRPLLAVQPAGALTVDFQPGETVRRELTLTPRPGSGLRITGARADLAHVRCRLDAPSSDGARRLGVELHPPVGPGDYAGAVRVETSDARLPVAVLAVTGRAQAGPVLSQSRVLLSSLRSVQPGQVLERVGVFTRSGALAVRKVETGTPALAASVETRQPGRFYEVVLTAPKGLPRGTTRTTVRILTDDRRSPWIELPFSATVE